MSSPRAFNRETLSGRTLWESLQSHTHSSRCAKTSSSPPSHLVHGEPLSTSPSVGVAPTVSFCHEVMEVHIVDLRAEEQLHLFRSELTGQDLPSSDTSGVGSPPFQRLDESSRVQTERTMICARKLTLRDSCSGW